MGCWFPKRCHPLFLSALVLGWDGDDDDDDGDLLLQLLPASHHAEGRRQRVG